MNILSGYKRLLIPLLFILAGCIVVHDFGEYWAKGYVERAFAGKWEDDKHQTLIFAPGDDGYRIQYSGKDEPAEAARSIKIGGQAFLMIKQKQYNVSGTLNMYAFNGKKLAFFGPNPDKKDEFTAKYGDSGIIIHPNSIEIVKLTPEIFALLTKIAQEKKYWQIIDVYNKVEVED